MSRKAADSIVALTILLANACLTWRLPATTYANARDELDRLVKEASR